MFYTSTNGVPFEIFLAQDERQVFQEMLLSEPNKVLKWFSRISMRDSTCWVLNDQNRIHGLVEGSDGFEKIDHVVRDAIAEALTITSLYEKIKNDFLELKAENSEFQDKNSRLKNEILQLRVENSQLKDEISHLKQKF